MTCERFDGKRVEFSAFFSRQYSRLLHIAFHAEHARRSYVIPFCSDGITFEFALRPYKSVAQHVTDKSTKPS